MGEPISYRLTIKELPAAERPRERLLRDGVEALSNAELLAILLRTGQGGENALQMASRLLAHFGGLEGLSRAVPSELAAMRGIGPAKSAQLKAGLELGRRLLGLLPEERPQVKSPADVAHLLLAEMSLLEQEEMRVLMLDSKNRLLASSRVYIGNLNTTLVRVAELFREAIRENAAALILVHNHPSGDPTPSSDDVAITREIIQAGKLLGLEVVDHLVIGRREYVSLRQRGLAFEE